VQAILHAEIGDELPVGIQAFYLAFSRAGHGGIEIGVKGGENVLVAKDKFRVLGQLVEGRRCATRRRKTLGLWPQRFQSSGSIRKKSPRTPRSQL